MRMAETEPSMVTTTTKMMTSGTTMGCAMIENCPHPEAAKAMINFLMSPEGQEALATRLETLRFTNPKAHYTIKYLPPDKVQLAEVSADAVEETKLPEWLSTVSGLNVKEGVEHCGSVDAYLDTLKIFAEAVASGAKELAGFYNAEDWKNYTTKVHALKSSARVIGADELSERARRLEDAGNSGRVEAIAEETEPLLEVYRSFAEKLSPLIKSADDDADKPLIGEDELIEAIETLKEMSASFDYDSVMFVLESLDEYRLPDEQAARIKKVREAVAKLDWDAVQSALE